MNLKIIPSTSFYSYNNEVRIDMATVPCSPAAYNEESVLHIFECWLVLFSSWSANQVVGPPKVYPQYGDIHGAWAPKTIDSHQYLEVSVQTVILTGHITL